MRVALVIQKLAGVRGGAERVAIELGAAMQSRGHDITFVTYEASGAAPAYEIGECSHVDLLPAPVRLLLRGERVDRRVSRGEQVASGRGNNRFFAVAKWHATHGIFARRLASWLRRHPHDAVVGFLPPAISAVAVAKSRLGAHAPRTIASTHSVPSLDFGDSPRWDQNPVTRRKNLWALSAVDAVTVLQREFRGELPSAAQGHAVVMPNAVAARVSAEPGVRVRRIIGVGRLSEAKQYDQLIRAFGIIGDEADDWSLVIYGDGPEHDRLLALIQSSGLASKVTLPGTTINLSDVYESSSIFAHPSRFEGFGLAVAEAILHGLPVVAWADCAGVSQLVENEVTGLLVAPVDDRIAEFAAALRRLIAEPLEENARRSGRDRLAGQLAPERVYDSWERLLLGE